MASVSGPDGPVLRMAELMGQLYNNTQSHVSVCPLFSFSRLIRKEIGITYTMIQVDKTEHAFLILPRS